MAKIGRSDEKPFNPISGKLVAGLTAPVKSPLAPAAEPPARLRAVPPEAATPARVEAQAITSERLERTKRFKLTQSEEIEIDEAIQRLSSSLRLKINFSHVSRCLWQLYLRNEEAILAGVRRTVNAPRPHNADAKALALFEEQLLQAILSAVTDPPR